jgi:hypothetical protein
MLDFSVTHPNYTKVLHDDYMRRFGNAQLKDFLLPYHFLRLPEEVVAPPQEAPRKYFMFLTASNITYSGRSNADRTVLSNLIQGERDSLFQPLSGREPPADAHAKMSESVFCLAPPGDTELATRHTDAILAGCIPVVLTHDWIPLPFDNILDWSRFAVRLKMSSLYDGTLLSTLRSKTPAQLREMRKEVYAVRPYFMISSDCATPSGFDLVLHQLALQKSRGLPGDQVTSVQLIVMIVLCLALSIAFCSARGKSRDRK